MRARAEGHRIAGGARWRFVSVANRARIVAKDLADARSRRRAANAGPSVGERQAELLGFYDRYERFVETLCEAAQYGPQSRLETRFLQDRDWVVDHYAPLRPYLSAFLAEEPDAFDRLLEADSLSRFMADDDGMVIFRITSTREALSLYAEHLRQLAARTAA